MAKLLADVVDYYATDKRLLRFRSESDYEALDYSEISVTLRRPVTRRIAVNLFRLFCVLSGLLAIGFGIVVLVDGLLFYALGFFVLGTIFFVPGPLVADSYYQIEAPGLEEKDLPKWRIYPFIWGGGRRFAQALQERCNQTRKGESRWGEE